MDDESFADAAEIVGILGKMVKRGKPGSSTTASSVSRAHSRSSRSLSHRDASVPTTVSPVPGKEIGSSSAEDCREMAMAVPDASMMNPI